MLEARKIEAKETGTTTFCTSLNAFETLEGNRRKESISRRSLERGRIPVASSIFRERSGWSEATFRVLITPRESRLHPTASPPSDRFDPAATVRKARRPSTHPFNRPPRHFYQPAQFSFGRPRSRNGDRERGDSTRVRISQPAFPFRRGRFTFPLFVAFLFLVSLAILRPRAKPDMRAAR